MKRLLGPLFISLLVLTGLGYLLSHSAEAREVAGEAVRSLLTFFFTPFVLETTVALIGLITVMTYNQWRLHKDGDGWVEMEVPTKPKTEDTESK
jgi:hypothetical protein